MTTLTKTMTLSVSSPAFESGGSIPSKYTCQGENVNPPLTIMNIPSNAKSLICIVDDPDAAGETFVHWVVWNIPPLERIMENSVPGIEGENGFGTTNYKGPCPPTGTHRYFFKVYALDELLEISAGAEKETVEKAMQEHVIAKGELFGTYRKFK